MPRLLKEGEARKVSLSVSVDENILNGVDENIKRIHSWLKSRFNVSDKELREISRSYFIRECLTLFSRPECAEIIKNSASLYLGLNANQTNLFDDENETEKV